METRPVHSIDAFDRNEWNALFGDELEDFSYYFAVEHAELVGFERVYFAVYEHGRPRAAVPASITDYRIDTTLSGPQATAVLELPYRSLDEYLATLGAATRKDMRRTLRARATPRIEWRADIDDVLDRVMTLYRATLANTEYRFEESTPTCFACVTREARGRALCATYGFGEKLIAFNLVLRNRHCLLDKFFGMEPARGIAA